MNQRKIELIVSVGLIVIILIILVVGQNRKMENYENSPPGYTCTPWSPINEKQGTNIKQGGQGASKEDNLTNCAKKCNETTGCEGYSYGGPKNKNCHLKKGIPSFTIDDKKPAAKSGGIHFTFCKKNCPPPPPESNREIFEGSFDRIKSAPPPPSLKGSFNHTDLRFGIL